ncbi:MAG: O-antigen ligase family protein [candidate division WOR-3 bacterium]
MSFFIAEAVCVIGFLVFMAAGQQTLAWACLVGPIQVILWTILAEDEYRVLFFFVLMLPLSAANLLPGFYQRLAFYPIIAVLLGLHRISQQLEGNSISGRKLTYVEWVPLVILAILVAVACYNAFARGWGGKFMLLSSLLMLEILAITYFSAQVSLTDRQVRNLLYTFVLSTAFCSICISFLPSPSETSGELGWKTVVTPFTLLNLNAWGCVIAVACIMALSLLLNEGRFVYRVLLVLVFLPLAAMLAVTQSRGAWLGFGLALLYILARVRSFRVIIIIGVALLALSSWHLVREMVHVRLTETSLKDPSLFGRLLLWKYAWDIGRANWLLGVGMENFRLVKHFYGYPYSKWFALRYNSHNLYLEFFADLGIFGVLALLWMFVVSFVRSYSLKKVIGHEDRGIRLALSAGLIAFAAHGLVDAFTYNQGTIALLSILVGLSYASYPVTPNRTDSEESSVNAKTS